MKDKKLWTHENFGKENEISYICKTLLQLVIQPVIKKIRLPLRGRPILLMTRVITNQIGFHSVMRSFWSSNKWLMRSFKCGPRYEDGGCQFHFPTISSFSTALYLLVQKLKMLQVKGLIAETRCLWPNKYSERKWQPDGTLAVSCKTSYLITLATSPHKTLSKCKLNVYDDS